MVGLCSAYGCNSKYERGGTITLHCFPKDAVKRRAWESRVKIKSSKVTKYSKLCSKHFTPDSFNKRRFGGTWLKSDALPTVFNFQHNLQENTVVRKTAKSRPAVKPRSGSDESRMVVKAKWRSLRATYRNELRNMPEKRDGEKDSKWKYFKSLNFLSDQFPDLNGTSSTDNEVDVSDTSSTKQRSLPSTQGSNHSVHQPGGETDERALISRILAWEQPNDEDVEARALMTRVEANNMRILKRQHQSITRDEDESFFDSLLPHVRTLAPQKKMMLRMRIQELVYDSTYGGQSTVSSTFHLTSGGSPNISEASDLPHIVNVHSCSDMELAECG